MKKIITLLLLLVCFVGVKAQSVIYSENFDAVPGYMITGWTNFWSGVVPWQCGLPFQVGGCMPPIGGPMSVDAGTNKVAAIAECGTMWDNNDSNVFSYTPTISLSTVTGAWLRYDSYFGQYISGTDTERAMVEISTDNGVTWSVLQHVPPSSPYGTFQTWYIDLSAYDHAANIRLGFRYRDDGGWMKGWAIDNIKIFVPPHKDIELQSATPTDTMLSYIPLNHTYTHHALVYNAGLDTIHSFTLNYRQDYGSVVSIPVTGLNIPAFATADIAHYIPDSVLLTGRHKVTMWASLTGDTNPLNDSAFTHLTGVNFVPSKKLAIESGEGTYNGWSPRNMYYLRSVPGLDVQACMVSVHEADPMVDTPYHDFLFNFGWNYVPYIMLDRRVSVPLDSFFTFINIQKKYFGFADIDLYGNIAGTTVTVNANVKPAMDMMDGYSLALVITQDGVHGTTPDYDQVNNYAAGAHGPMGGFETMPAVIPAANMSYDYVARKISSCPTGDFLASELLSGNTYPMTLTTTLDPAWGTSRLKAIVFLIRNSDSVILNSNQTPFYLEVPKTSLTFSNAIVYPNPANDVAKVSFYLDQPELVTITLSDVSGRVILTQTPVKYDAGGHIVPLSVERLSTGIYLINLTSEDGNKTLKLEILK